MEIIPRIAVLIDAENVSPQIVDALFLQIGRLGEAVIRRAYGDFLEPDSNPGRT